MTCDGKTICLEVLPTKTDRIGVSLEEIAVVWLAMTEETRKWWINT